jgi:phage-related protein
MVHLNTTESDKRLPARFYRTEQGAEPVREWLLSLPLEDRRTIGSDIKDAEFAWPIGMPLCRSLTGHKGLWEIRSTLPSRRIARILFFIADGEMILLHGFIKKSQKTDTKEIATALHRRKNHEQH